MDRRTAHQLIIAQLKTFPNPIPTTAEDFCATLSEMRKRPITIRVASLPQGVSGMWLADDEADHILHRPVTSVMHRELIIYHEGVHIWLHQPAQIVLGRISTTALSRLDLTRMHMIMHRHVYSEPEEIVAETGATELLLRSSSARGRRADRVIGVDVPANAATLAAATTRLLNGLVASLEESGEDV